MHPVAQYFCYTYKRNIPLILAITLIPAALPFILYGIMFTVINKLSDVRLTPVQVEKLPQTDRVAYNDSNLVYFSYAPDRPEYAAMVQRLFQMNNITNARTKAFADEQAANKYFSIKNILPEGRQHYANSSFYNSIICQDLRRYLSEEIADCNF